MAASRVGRHAGTAPCPRVGMRVGAGRHASCTVACRPANYDNWLLTTLMRIARITLLSRKLTAG